MGQISATKIRKSNVSGRSVRNAAPKSYRAKFIEPGIISYNDQGDGVVFVSKEALDRMAPSFKGCPVIFVPEHHNDSEPNTAFNFENDADPPAGIVASDPEWGNDGWQYVNLLVWDPEAQQAIQNGYSVSCAYWMDDSGPGGDWHNIQYDEEMKDGHYLHMAIVPRPRYEGSQIKANSKGGHTVAIKLFHKNSKRRRNADEKMVPLEGDVPKKDDHEGMDVMNAEPDSVVQLPGGGQATLQELIEAYRSAAPEDGGPETELDPDDQIDVDGKSVTVGELIAAFQAKDGNGDDDESDDSGMENADPPINTPAAEVVDTTKQGTGILSNGKRRVNSRLRIAANQAPGDGLGVDKPDTRHDRLQRGAARYSRSVTQEGNK